MTKTLRAFQYLLVLAVGIGNTLIVSAQEQQESKRSHDIRYTMTLSTTPPAQQKCAARLLFTFIQMNTVAAVESTLSNAEQAWKRTLLRSSNQFIRNGSNRSAHENDGRET